MRGIFDVEPLEPVQVKGKKESVRVYQVTAAKPHSFRMATRGVQGIETRMVGRSREFNQLQDLYKTAVRQKRLRVATIVADAGVGKSRLLYEFINWVEVQPGAVTLLRGRATPETGIVPYALMRSMFAAFFDIQESDSPDEVRRKLEEGVARYLVFQTGDVVEKAHYIGRFLDFQLGESKYLEGILGDVQKFREIARFYLAQLLRAAAAEQPLLLVFDDIHWADDRSLDVIDYLAGELRTAPLLIVAIARPALLERRPQWSSDPDRYTRLDLDPLTPEESGELVREILRLVENVPDDLSALIVERAEGNPLYVEELIKKLIEDGIITMTGQAWQVRIEKLETIDVPTTLTGLLQSRLDSLPESERSELQRAAVVGRIFWNDSLAYLSEGDEETVVEALSALRAREIIYGRERSAFSAMEEYIFKHAILHDVTYESVLLQLRRMYHARAADWLVRSSAERLNEYAALIASHYERAGQHDQAVAYLTRAGDFATRFGSNPDARVLYEKAVGLLDDPQAEEAAALHCKLGDVLMQMGRYQEAEERYSNSLKLANKRGDLSQIADAMSSMGQLAHEQGEYDRAVSYLLESLAIAEDQDNRRLMSQTLNTLGHVSRSKGDYSSAENYYNRTMQLFEELEDRAGIAQARGNLTILAHASGNYVQAQEQALAALAAARSIGYRRLESRLLLNLGAITATMDDFKSARQYFTASLNILREIGDREGTLFVLNNLGALAEDQLDLAGARAYYEQSLAIAGEIGVKTGIAFALINLGSVSLLLKQLDEARSYFRQALQQSHAIGATPEVLAALGGFARVHAARGETQQAAELAGLVTSHPSVDRQTSDTMEEMLTTLREQAAEEAVSAALEKGKARALETVVAELLGDNA
ncbi:MAG: tetratricopeptide repeat protein [Chloroflexi bacterium]|nr:tetratricopeptide repeat protein [Chloroflexota bacterium]